MDINRRGFLKLMAAVPVAIVLPSASKIWVPEHFEIEVGEILKPVVGASENGDLVCGWIMPDEIGPDDMEMVKEYLFDDAFRYFPENTPIMALRDPGILNFSVYRRASRMKRFMWRGNGSPIAEGLPMTIMATWNDRARMVA